MYQEIAQHDLYNQIPFYELGRSFWFWSPQLQFHAPDQDPVVTGFAVWMRFRSMAAANVQGAPFNGTPFTTFASQVAGLAGQYEAEPVADVRGHARAGPDPRAFTEVPTSGPRS